MQIVGDYKLEKSCVFFTIEIALRPVRHSMCRSIVINHLASHIVAILVHRCAVVIVSFNQSGEAIIETISYITVVTQALIEMFELFGFSLCLHG